MQGDPIQGFSSRSIQHLDNLIGECQDSNQRLVLFAKKAGNLARLSRFTEARSLVKDLRAVNSAYEPRLSAWIIFAEGLIEHFETLNNAKAKDKFHRAFLVGQMAGDHEIAGAASAWMAHCELVSGQIKEAVDHVATAFEWSNVDSSEARGRASMVLADALNCAGKTDMARQWYHEARSFAVRDGDIAMQNVMLFNMATFGVANLTLRDCFGPLDANDWRLVALEVASAGNLNSALGIQSLASMVPIVRAELLVIQRNWTDALALYDQHIPIVVNEGQKRLLPKLLAQCAWCRSNTRDMEGAIMSVHDAINQLGECSDLDDLSVTHFRISAVCKQLQKHELEIHHQTLALSYFDKFKKHQLEIETLLNPVLASIKPQTKARLKPGFSPES